jgi:hypothetical protein
VNKFAGGKLFFAAALLALVVPINAFAVDIGGPTAEDWVNSGAVAEIGVTLEAIPANEPLHAYTFPGADSVFDAVDRDTLLPVAAPYGLGVSNTLIWSGLPGVSSVPSEIGYYGNPGVCGTGQELGANCADELRVKLDQAVTGGSVDVSFFYGSEQAGELLQVELWSGGVLVASSTEGPANNGVYGPTNPGFYTFALAEDICWDEIRFIGHSAVVTDASDILVEGMANLDVCGLKKELTSGPDANFDGEIDLAVEVGQLDPTFYDFDITYFDPANPFVVIEDTVPAEWHVIEIQGDDTDLPLGCGEDTSFDGDYGTVDVSRGGKVGKDCQSDTDIQWVPPEEGATINVQTEARCHDNRNNTKCKPTSCGALYLNYGAVAYDEFGELVAGPTAPLCLAAVSDLDGEVGIDYTGAGDEDEDGISDYEEACGIGTDPCDADTDNDGVNDGDDACALLGDEGDGVDGNGCPIRACTVLDNQGGSGGYTYSLLLEGDGTVASGVTDAYLPDTADTPVTGSFDPNGLVSLRADRAALNSCTPRSDYFTISASCTTGSCTGAGGFESFTSSGATCFGPADWAGVVIEGCNLSNPSQPD